MGMVWVASLANEEQVAEIRQNPDAAYDFANSEEAYDSGRQIDLDKQWHGVHFLLTGSAGATDSPLSIILGQFEEIGPDNGLGPAWVVPSSAWAAFHEKLSALTDADIRARFDTEAMSREGIYLADLFADECDEALGFLMQDVARLRKFAEQATQNTLNAIAVIT